MSRTWPELPVLPKYDVPLIDAATGRLTRDWYRYLTVMDAILRGTTKLSMNDLADVDAASPADGDVMTYVAADSAWKGV